MKLNSITTSDLLIDNGQVWKDTITGEDRIESFNDLYTNSINDTLSAIEEVNRYLYGNKFISDIESVFEDLSYDTGKRCLYKGIH